MLRRLVLILMLAILPVQWTWAAAASVCQHETIAAGEASHFGHHEHHHDADAIDVDGPGVDTDCPSCHFAAPALLMPQIEAQPPLPAAAAVTPYRRSVTAGLPERLIRPPHAFLVA